ncbi:MAG: hypothetical protein KY432_03800, partial [Acidobacteria bacterium]|nr:hypothetical protein [Acidobacteriota bacterium]
MSRPGSIWKQQARLFAVTFGSVTSGLTSAMPTEKPDNNVDMIVGGQAVLEGVMMRGYGGYSVAVRQPDGGIAIRQDKIELFDDQMNQLRQELVDAVMQLDDHYSDLKA